jgi:hypothetical protein
MNMKITVELTLVILQMQLLEAARIVEVQYQLTMLMPQEQMAVILGISGLILLQLVHSHQQKEEIMKSLLLLEAVEAVEILAVAAAAAVLVVIEQTR